MTTHVRYCTETRPNGKVYRARKQPTVEFFDGEWPSESSALALRMDSKSPEEARQLVIEEAKRYDPDITLVNSGHFGWWRLVMRNHEPVWDYDSVTGVPGWYFEVE